MSGKVMSTIASVVLAFTIGLGVLLWRAPSSSRAKAAKKPQNIVHYNLCVLLDLSNRIDPAKFPDQAQKDMAIIRNVFAIFKDQVKKKIYIRSKDRIQIAIAPQPVKTDYSAVVYETLDSLKIDMGRLTVVQKSAKKFPVLEKAFAPNLGKLYEMAVKNPNFVGADIWGFFKDDVENHIVALKDDSVRNVLIILTDGYIEFNSAVMPSRPQSGNRTSFMNVDWFLRRPNEFAAFDRKDYGLIPFNKKLGNLEVLVLEVRPKDILNTMEYDIIKKYWYKWFDEMGIKKRSLHKTQDSPEQVKRIIEDFIFFGKTSDYNLQAIPKVIVQDLPVPSNKLQVDIPKEEKVSEKQINIGKAKIESVITRKEIEKLPTSEVIETASLRSVPKDNLSELEVYDMIKRHDFYCTYSEWSKDWANSEGKGIVNNFVSKYNNKVILDHSTNLMWQRSGSQQDMIFADAENYILKLNAMKFAGFSDWRLPTLEEAMSLIKRGKSKRLYIVSKFDEKQRWIWTADKVNADTVWVVRYDVGRCNYGRLSIKRYVRAVR